MRPAWRAATQEEVESLVKSTGFFRNKARNLIGLAQALMTRHGGQVPSDPAALGALPGVGQKTANVVLANAFGVPALAVDTHIFRVARRLGLSKATTPEKVEADLCRLFPREDWIELHHQLIFHGRRTCDARRPDCAGCALLELCPTGLGKIKDPHLGVKLTPPEVRLQPSAFSLQSSTPDPQELSQAGPLRIAQPGALGHGAAGPVGAGGPARGAHRYCIEPRWIRNFRAHRGRDQGPRLRPHPRPGAGSGDPGAR